MINRNHKTILAAIGIAASLGFSYQMGHWQKQGRGIAESTVGSVAVGAQEISAVYGATDRTVYRSGNNGISFERIMALGGVEQVNDIAIFNDTARTVLLATSEGLYRQQNGKVSAERIFTSSDEMERQVSAVAVTHDALIIGTLGGVFVQKNGTSSWQKLNGFLSDKKIIDIIYDNDELWVATSSSVYKGDWRGNKFSKIYSFGAETAAEELAGDEETQTEEDVIQSLDINSVNHRLVIGSTKGIIIQEPNNRWSSLPSVGLPLARLRDVIFLPQTTSHGTCQQGVDDCLSLLAGTSQGTYLYSNGVWQAVYKGMAANTIFDLAVGHDGTVYAATDDGLYTMNTDDSAVSVHQVVMGGMEQFDDEPSIIEVHRLAIDYAEVNNDKIKEWRRLAKKRAWFPSFDVGFDGGRGFSRSDSIYGSSSGGGTHYIAPDDKGASSDFGWDVSLSWDLADVVWSSDQTSIDSRAKLMVELREDILDQVTRLYFERRRLQMELSGQMEALPQERIDKKLRIAELTALIDGYTGGRFSEKINRN